MRTHPNQRHLSQGSVLMVTLFVSTIIGVVLGSYLFMIRSQNLSVARAQTWNAALAMAEAGIEETMAHLNPGVVLANLQPDAHGWSFSDGFYRMPGTRDLAGGYYNAVFDGVFPQYHVYSTGYTRAPISGQIISRTVKVDTDSGSLFWAGVAAKTSMTLNGNTITIDSYDSANTADFPGGRYTNYANTAKAYLNEHGDVAMASTATNAADLGVGNIKGKIRTGPGGVPKVLKNGSIGSAAWVDADKSGIQPGWWTDDMNLEYPDVLPPFSSGSPLPSSVSTNGTNYYTLDSSGNYMVSSLTLKNRDILFVPDGRRVVLYVTGDLLMQSGSYINLGPNGARLKIYVGGNSATFSTVNFSPDANAASFGYFGLPTNTQLNWSGNATFMGTVYAPNAVFTLSGGGTGSNPWDYEGACVVDQIVMNGHFNFHFDENLKKKAPFDFLVVTSWKEL